MQPRLLVGFFVVLVLGGCATSRVPEERPRTLSEVNEQLDERWARIRHTEGRLLDRLEDVQVGPDTTTYYHRFDQAHRGLPTDSVRTVQIQTGGGGGFITGAAPGLAAAFMGAGVAAVHSGDDNPGATTAGVVGIALVGGGLLAGLVGGTIGAIVGGATSDEEWRTVYRAPVTKYR
jgi:hypothetical protein